MTTDDALTAAADLAYVQALKERAEKAEAEVERLKTIYAELLQQSLKTTLETEETARKALQLIRERAGQRHKQFGCDFSDWILDVCYAARTQDMEALTARDDTCDPDVARAIGEALVREARAEVELIAARDLIAQLRTEYEPECACDVCRAIAKHDEKVRGRDE